LPAYFRYIRDNWFNLFIVVLILHLMFQKDITIRFQLHDREAITAAVPAQPSPQQTSAQVLPTSLPIESESNDRKDKRLANTFSNLTFILNSNYAKQKNVPIEIVEEKLNNCLAYVQHYYGEAQIAMREYGIPASITLAQGLLESNAGASRLARESNNHFGIKCRSKCRGCTCRNYTDDDIYDMFRVFTRPLESYREHSVLLTSKRYRHLNKLGRTNYQAWAHGLKRAGYATDKRYAEKLIRIIETLGLDRYDS
ncbi:MAG: glucosaminidase domain-containing protein, partial [Lewinella sp.]|nr:glucosaminidase domain-containing protein [Lewinella sp.]